MGSADQGLTAPSSETDEPGPVADPVAAAVILGRQKGTPAGSSLRHALAEARDLLAQARRDGAFRASLPGALDLVRRHPEAEDLQLTAARLIMEDGDPRALACWVGIHQRFPSAPEPFRMRVRLTRRTSGQEAAEALFHERFADGASIEGEAEWIAYAHGLEELGHTNRAEDAFAETARCFPDSRAAWRRLMALQEARGALLSAQRSAAAGLANCGGDQFARAHVRLTRQILTLERFSPGQVDLASPASVTALEGILTEAMAARFAAGRQPRRYLGSMLMISGSLGSGGAERQLITTALALNEAVREGRIVGGHELVGPVEVAVRSLAASRDNDFHLETLTAAGVQVTEYRRLAAFGGAPRLSGAKAFQQVVHFLPPTMREGVVQLVDFIRCQAPDVAHIWQDGMVFAAGLAALIAQVPRIVLAVRSLPPTDRVNRWRLELEPIYRALLQCPGVILTANSTLAARRYETWLGIEPNAIPVIHNGVSRLSEVPAAGDEELFSVFERRTIDADFTVGAVMRLDHNKRPLEWLTVAERLHRRHRNARFIIVGDGALRAECMEWSRRLGLSDRLLFTGRSGSVGYWLARVDALMLLSRFEGMPNVLIEAQLAGVPVVTTPAGGAAETLVGGQTGFLLASAEAPVLDEAVERLMELRALGREGRRRMGEAARAWAEQSFSVRAMLERTVEVFMTPDDGPILRPTRPDR